MNASVLNVFNVCRISHAFTLNHTHIIISNEKDNDNVFALKTKEYEEESYYNHIIININYEMFCKKLFQGCDDN